MKTEASVIRAGTYRLVQIFVLYTQVTVNDIKAYQQSSNHNALLLPHYSTRLIKVTEMQTHNQR